MPRPEPTPVAEILADRTVKSATWRNSDGSLTVRQYVAPHFYRSKAGGGAAAFAPIDPTLSPVTGRSGMWRSKANAWAASFGPANGAGGAEQVTAGSATVGFTPENVAIPGLVPTVTGATATYPSLWSGTDLVEQVTSTGVKESMVLAGPSSPASYSFTVSGGTVRQQGLGAEVVTAGGVVAGQIPAPTVRVMGKKVRRTESVSGVRLVAVGDTVTVSVTRAWLQTLPASAFPVVIDPTFTPGALLTASAVGAFSASGQTSTSAQFGTDGYGDTWAATAYVPLPAPPAPAAGQRPWVMEEARFFAFCHEPHGCGVKNQYLWGELTKPTSGASAQGGTFLYRQHDSVLDGGILTLITPWVAAHPGGSWFAFGGDPQVPTSLLSLQPSDIFISMTYVEEPPPPPVVSPRAGSTIATATPTVTAQVTDAYLCPYTEQTTVSGVSCDHPNDVTYDFQVFDAPPGSGGHKVADSGWLPQPFTVGSTNTAQGYPVILGVPSWVIPAGSLADGVTYYLSVRDSDSVQNPYALGNQTLVPPAAALPATPFTLRQRLGGGGPSPTDTVGAAPGQTSTPSQGAPNPGTSPSSETVNMVTGNLALSVGTGAVSALGGPAGVSLSYNSLQAASASAGSSASAGYGLTGSYYPDSGNHTFPASGGAFATRVDPTVDLSNGANGPVGAMPVQQPYLVQWVGAIAPSAGTWALGGVSGHGGLRVYLDGASTPVFDNWSAASTGLTFASSSIAGGGTHQIEVDAWVDPNQWLAPIQLWADNLSGATPVPSVVPSTWLRPQASGLAPGWSMNQAGVPWTSLTDLGSQVVAHSASGGTEVFTRLADSTYASGANVTAVHATYLAEPGSSDQLSVVNGQLQLASSSGFIAVFNGSGQLVNATTSRDDRHPAALQYGYSPASGSPGAPVVLTSITDPTVSDPAAKVLATLSYGSSTACTVGNSAGLLCGVALRDGTGTSLVYNSNNQLAKVTSSGGAVTLLGYEAGGRVNDVRDALANDYIAANQTGASACTAGAMCPFDTAVVYDAAGRVSTVTQPSPTSGAAQPQRSYTYLASTTGPGAGSTQVSIAGFTPPANATLPAGVASSVSYDHSSRIIAQTDTHGLSSHTVWDAQDRPVVTVSPTGQQSSTLYDADSNVTDTYGPAPVGCFSAASWPAGLPAPTAPIVGYLPVVNPASTAGCSVPAVAHSHNGYDEGITGLGQTYWSNGQLAGPAVLHATGIPAATPNCTVTKNLIYGSFGADYASNVPTQVCGSWAAGSPPVTPDRSGQWSMRMTGRLNWTAADQGDVFVICDTQPVALLIDGQQITTNLDPNDPDNPDYPSDVVPCGMWELTLTPGSHLIEIDLSGVASQATSYSMIYQSLTWNSTTQSHGPWTGITASQLSPAYGLHTSSTDPDGKTTATTYTGGGIDPAYGMPTATTVDTGAGHLNLTTATTYEPASSSTYLRRLSTTLPAGNSTTYSYYADSSGPLAAVCGVAAGTLQGGKLLTQTDPAPGAGAPSRTQQFVYDSAGRQAGRRVGPSTSISSVSWQCTGYDGRGRMLTQSWPATTTGTTTAPARAVTHAYAVGGNPLASSIADTSGGGTISSVVDLLGRMVSYTDAAGKTSTSSYDQAGRAIGSTSVQGVVAYGFTPTGDPATVTRNGTVLATASYDAVTEHPTGVAYSNGTKAAMGYDGYGGQNSLTFTNSSSGVLITGNQTTRSVGGRIVNELTVGTGSTLTNANPAGLTAADYSYDGAGRLASAYLRGSYATYGYATNTSGDGCANTGQGANTNRTQDITTPTGGTATVIDSCYNTADQLTRTVTGSTVSTQFSYDGHGNQLIDAGTALTWDASDRLTKTVTSTSTTMTYAYDAVDRVIGRSNGTTTTQYTYAGFSDTPTGILDTTGTLLQAFVGLPGGAMITVQAAGNIWSYPDLHGNYTATASDSGTRQGTPVAYDPWGKPTTGQTPVTNATGGSNLGAFGSAGKVTDTTTNITIMGARPYNPAEARFLTVDPIQGGCADMYTYSFGDPMQHSDLGGQGACVSEFQGNCGESYLDVRRDGDKIKVDIGFNDLCFEALYADSAIASTITSPGSQSGGSSPPITDVLVNGRPYIGDREVNQSYELPGTYSSAVSISVDGFIQAFGFEYGWDFWNDTPTDAYSPILAVNNCVL